jgi:hypothetical protein
VAQFEFIGSSGASGAIVYTPWFFVANATKVSMSLVAPERTLNGADNGSTLSAIAVEYTFDYDGVLNEVRNGVASKDSKVISFDTTLIQAVYGTPFTGYTGGVTEASYWDLAAPLPAAVRLKVTTGTGHPINPDVIQVLCLAR